MTPPEALFEAGPRFVRRKDAEIPKGEKGEGNVTAAVGSDAHPGLLRRMRTRVAVGNKIARAVRGSYISEGN